MDENYSNENYVVEEMEVSGETLITDSYQVINDGQVLDGMQVADNTAIIAVNQLIGQNLVTQPQSTKVLSEGYIETTQPVTSQQQTITVKQEPDYLELEDQALQSDDALLVYVVDDNESAEESGEAVVLEDHELSNLLTVLKSSPEKMPIAEEEPKVKQETATPDPRMRRSSNRGVRRTTVRTALMSEQRHQCLRCLAVFVHGATMAKHAQKHQHHKSYLRCTVCRQQLATNQKLKKHLLAHNDDRVHKCHVCSKALSVKLHLKLHVILNHTSGYCCTNCFKRFRYRNLLQKHKLWCHSASVGLLHCHICGIKVSNSKKALKDHIVKHHLTLPEEDSATELEGDLFKYLVNKRKGSNTVENSLQNETEGQVEEMYIEGLGEEDFELIKEAINNNESHVAMMKKEKHWQQHSPQKSYTQASSMQPSKFMQIAEDYEEPILTSRERKEIERLDFFECCACEFATDNFPQMKSHVFVHRTNQRLTDGSTKTTEGVFLCKYCGRNYLNKQEYDEHYELHNLIRRFKCSFCTKRFITMQSLQVHEATHNEDLKLECEICQKRLSSQKNLDAHMLLHDNSASEYCCEVCGRGFKKKYSFDIHMMRHGNAPMPYQCPVCSKGFLSLNLLQQHMDRFHTGDNDGSEGTCTCHTCGATFANMSDVLSHASSHQSDIKQFKCDICPRGFTSKQALLIHAKRHSECPYQCQRCQKLFPLPDKLDTHMKKCVRRNLEHKVSRPFKCQECPRAFCSSQGLYKHRRYQHDLPVTTRRGRKPHNRALTNTPLTCQHCNTVVIGETELRAHMEQHVARVMYVCGTCEEQFTSEAKLKFHMAAHTGLLLYKCGVCEDAFPNASQLKEHIDKHGERGARFCCKCGFCGKLCTYVSLLVKHIKMHTDEKEYKCEECGKYLRNVTTYRTHMMRHKGAFRFQCAQCPKKFLFRGDYDKHIIKHANSKPHVCDQCNKAYATKYSLQEHKRIHTGSYPYTCNDCGKGFSFPSHYESHIRKHVLDKTISQGYLV